MTWEDEENRWCELVNGENSDKVLSIRDILSLPGGEYGIGKFFCNQYGDSMEILTTIMEDMSEQVFEGPIAVEVSACLFYSGDEHNIHQHTKIGIYYGTFFERLEGWFDRQLFYVSRLCPDRVYDWWTAYTWEPCWRLRSWITRVRQALRCILIPNYKSAITRMMLERSGWGEMDAEEYALREVKDD